MLIWSLAYIRVPNFGEPWVPPPLVAEAQLPPNVLPPYSGYHAEYGRSKSGRCWIAIDSKFQLVRVTLTFGPENLVVSYLLEGEYFHQIWSFYDVSFWNHASDREAQTDGWTDRRTDGWRRFVIPIRRPCNKPLTSQERRHGSITPRIIQLNYN